MILKSPKSKISVVNLLADFILNKIPHNEESIIQVIDCHNFIVIKGKTTFNNPLDISSIKDEFISKFSKYIDDRKIFPTIDLIEYDSKIEKKDTLTHTFHNTENCSYHYKQVDKYLSNPNYSYDYNNFVNKIKNDSQLTFSSEFPHGYSLGQGRLSYYYCKNIFYKIPPSYPVTTLTFTITNKKDEFGDIELKVTDNFSQLEDLTLKSAILDFFDFDMTELEEKIKKMDWSFELTNPLEDYSFLKSRNKDFIII